MKMNKKGLGLIAKALVVVLVSLGVAGAFVSHMAGLRARHAAWYGHADTLHTKLNYDHTHGLLNNSVEFAVENAMLEEGLGEGKGDKRWSYPAPSEGRIIADYLNDNTEENILNYLDMITGPEGRGDLQSRTSIFLDEDFGIIINTSSTEGVYGLENVSLFGDINSTTHDPYLQISDSFTVEKEFKLRFRLLYKIMEEAANEIFDQQEEWIGSFECTFYNGDQDIDEDDAGDECWEMFEDDRSMEEDIKNNIVGGAIDEIKGEIDGFDEVDEISWDVSFDEEYTEEFKDEGDEYIYTIDITKFDVDIIYEDTVSQVLTMSGYRSLPFNRILEIEPEEEAYAELYHLEVEIDGEDYGDVDVSWNGEEDTIEGDGESYWINSGADVTLNALSKSEDYFFLGWEGDKETTDNEIDIEMDGHKYLRAEFAECVYPTLTVKRPEVVGEGIDASDCLFSEGILWCESGTLQCPGDQHARASVETIEAPEHKDYDEAELDVDCLVPWYGEDEVLFEYEMCHEPPKEISIEAEAPERYDFVEWDFESEEGRTNIGNEGDDNTYIEFLHQDEVEINARYERSEDNNLLTVSASFGCEVNVFIDGEEKVTKMDDKQKRWSVPDWASVTLAIESGDDYYWRRTYGDTSCVEGECNFDITKDSVARCNRDMWP